MSSADKTKLDGLGGGGSYTLPIADATTLGGVKIGANVTITGGVISVAAPITSNAGLTNDAGYLTQHQSLAGYALISQLPAAQVNADWNASSGVAQILNKPTIPAAQVASDWNASSGVAAILNKPTLGTAAATNATAYATAAQGATADAAWPAASLTGATKIAVVSALPGTPDSNTLYFVTP
jgi:hypothetical protein